MKSLKSVALAALPRPLDEYAQDCHGASLALVRSGALGQARVARGSTPGVGGQHSWVVIGHRSDRMPDPYDPDVFVVDPTLWSYVDSIAGVWVGSASERPHRPHGAGSIFAYGRPTTSGGEPIELTPKAPLSRAALDFLELLGPLDRAGWSALAHAPVGDWPAGELIAAMYDTEAISALIPIDIVGMVTDRNPSGLYLP